MLKIFVLLVSLYVLEALHIDNGTTAQYIDGSTIELFESKFASLQKSDVLSSTLYAQILANHSYCRFSDFSKWYQTYVSVLEEVGWTLYISDFEVHFDNLSTTYQEAVKKILSDDLSETEKNHINKTLNKLYSNASMANFFSQQSAKGDIKNFQILILNANQAGDSVMSFNGFIIDGTYASFGQLFISFGLGILKESVYAVHRDNVSLFIKDYVESYVIEF